MGRRQKTRIPMSTKHVDFTAATGVRTEDELYALIEKIADPLLLILDRIQDPHNLGACLRTADAAGVHAVVAPKDRAVALTDTVRRVAAGAAEHVPFVQVTNLVRTLGELQGDGMRIIGTSDEAKGTLYDADLTGPLAIAMFFGGSVLMALVYFPNLANMIRWPGLTLFLSGTVVYVAGKVLESNVSDRLGDAIQFGVGGVSPVPSSVARLATYLLVSFGHNLTSGISGPALTVLIVGLVLFVASFFVFLVRPFIPFFK